MKIVSLAWEACTAGSEETKYYKRNNGHYIQKVLTFTKVTSQLMLNK